MLKSYYDYFIYNGELKPSDDYDAGLFCRGKSIYEVVRLIDDTPLFLSEHLQRLSKSAGHMDREIGMGEEKIIGEIYRLAEANKVSNGNIEIILNYCAEERCETNYLLLFIEQRYPSEKAYREGVGAITFEISRERPQIKQINLDLRKFTAKTIGENNIYEVILVEPEGEITEGSRSNVYFIDGDKIYTPPVHMVLPGITRQKIFEICKSNAIEIIEKKINKSETDTYQSAFITGTSPKVLPLKHINNFIYDPSNTLLRRIMQEYDRMITEHIRDNKERWFVK